MVVDGLRKYLVIICYYDFFEFCYVVSIDVVIEGGVNFYKDSEILE